MPLETKKGRKISEEEYLDGELVSKVKREYIDGYVYVVPGASKNHDRITRNISNILENEFIKNSSPCETFSSDMKVKESEKTTKYLYPDVLITCNSDNSESEYDINSPVIVVEVLSQSTRKYDLTSKKLYYFNMPTLLEYVVIEQDICQVEVFKKSDDWRSTVYFLDDEITFESIDVTISVEKIYRRVDNKDMAEFLSSRITN